MISETPLKVAVLQMRSIDDTEFNEAQLRDLLGRLNSKKTLDVISLPENSLFFRIEKLSGQKHCYDLSELVFEELSALANANGCVVHVGGVPLWENNQIYNATIWIEPGQRPEVVYKKIHLFDVELKSQSIKESDFFKPGEHLNIKELKGWRCAFSICYDVRFSELYLNYARKKADLIFVPSAFTRPTGKAHWHTLLRARAIESQSYVVAAAQSGVHQSVSGKKRSTYGHSLVVNPWGEVLLDIEEEGPAVEVVTLAPETLQNVREQIPMEQHRKLR